MLISKNNNNKPRNNGYSAKKFKVTYTSLPHISTLLVIMPIKGEISQYLCTELFYKHST